MRRFIRFLIDLAVGTAGTIAALWGLGWLVQALLQLILVGIVLAMLATALGIAGGVGLSAIPLLILVAAAIFFLRAFLGLDD